MEEEPTCAYCAGQRGNDSLRRLGLEPSPLEQEVPHDPDCPLLNRKPQRRWMRHLVLALLPAAMLVPGCETSTSPTGPRAMGGLDDGTISALPAPDVDGSLG